MKVSQACTRSAPGPGGYEEHCRELVGQAVLEERARIARELHDVLAHHMSLTAVRAEAALVGMPGLPDAASEVLEVVRDAARAALAETRRIVGALRDGGQGVEGVPGPGLGDVAELVGAARGVGLRVSVSVVGAPRPVDVGVELAAFRVVQESLSNAVRYAPGARVTVEIAYGPAALTVAVVDDGARMALRAPRGGGHGLAGMRERVTLLGGTLRAGRAGDGAGWSVLAELPYAGLAPASGQSARSSEFVADRRIDRRAGSSAVGGGRPCG
ncbi:sensor histidine kinase [Actinomadura sp. 21ATH]|uniref:sensor histidine kinase n=1 Tax=Actinomadura sp. 21ATH TaxID=1735444 RepID=UPI0035C21EC9